jgi:hypothetical protein
MVRLPSDPAANHVFCGLQANGPGNPSQVAFSFVYDPALNPTMPRGRVTPLCSSCSSNPAMDRNSGFPEATQRFTASCQATMLGQPNLKTVRMTQTGERWRDLSIDSDRMGYSGLIITAFSRRARIERSLPCLISFSGSHGQYLLRSVHVKADTLSTSQQAIFLGQGSATTEL